MSAPLEARSDVAHVQEEADPSRFQSALSYCRDLGHNALMGIARGKIMRSALALGLTIGAGTVAGTATEMVTPNPTVASADNGGYPDWNKPCVAENNYGKTEGIGNWCNDYQWGDSPSQQNSPRGYGYRNCTDFVA